MSRPKPLITVLIPVLNGMPYLTEALASLEQQTFKGFQVIVWDNGSTDGSAEEARRWIPARLAGKVVVDEPLPLHQCLAAMVEAADTHYCARMDGDDICSPDRLRLQIDFMEKNPVVDLVGCQIECINANGTVLDKGDWAQYPTKHEDIVSRLMFVCPFNHPSILFRREAVIQAGNYSVPAPVEDLNLYLKMVRRSKVANLQEVGVHYRIHEASICAGAKVDDRHAQLTSESMAAEAESVFRISTDVFHRLKRQDYPVSALPLLLGAWRRADHAFAPFWRIVASPVFIKTARCLTRPGDRISKAIYRLLALI